DAQRAWRCGQAVGSLGRGGNLLSPVLGYQGKTATPVAGCRSESQQSGHGGIQQRGSCSRGTVLQGGPFPQARVGSQFEGGIGEPAQAGRRRPAAGGYGSGRGILRAGAWAATKSPRQPRRRGKPER